MTDIVFIILAVFFYTGLAIQEEPIEYSNTIVGKQAPEINLALLGDGLPPTNADMRLDRVKLVNFWASWCGPCRAEHPMLEAIHADDITIYGINYKDNPDRALQYLTELGNPYTQIGADYSGQTAIDWGVTGIPETLVIDTNGVIILRHSGPITQRIYDETIAPAIAAAGQ